jgi:hypothetical protein
MERVKSKSAARAVECPDLEQHWRALPATLGVSVMSSLRISVRVESCHD